MQSSGWEPDPGRQVPGGTKQNKTGGGDPGLQLCMRGAVSGGQDACAWQWGAHGPRSLSGRPAPPLLCCYCCCREQPPAASRDSVAADTACAAACLKLLCCWPKSRLASAQPAGGTGGLRALYTYSYPATRPNDNRKVRSLTDSLHLHRQRASRGRGGEASPLPFFVLVTSPCPLPRVFFRASVKW